MVAPSSIATSKSPLMPMLKCGKGAPKAASASAFNSRNFWKYGRARSGSGVNGGIAINP